MITTGASETFDEKPSVDQCSLTSAADYVETIEILQEEIARLEHELQVREESRQASASEEEPLLDDDGGSSDSSEALGVQREEIERLNAELAGRDETIILLLDELSRLEEAQEAGRAEWEQLNGWLAELERRVEGQDGNAMLQLENELAAQRHRLEAVQAKSEQDRRGWEAQRQLYQEEMNRVQAALDQAVAAGEAARNHDDQASQARAADASVIETLQAENIRLRAAWQEMVNRASAAKDSESQDARLAEILNERHQLRRRLEQLQDEKKREQLEHEATLTELRARLSQASQPQPQPPPQPPQTEHKNAGGSNERDLDLRVRALRQHLQEIEENERKEREERRQKNLVVRLSRLWSRTGPR